MPRPLVALALTLPTLGVLALYWYFGYYPGYYDDAEYFLSGFWYWRRLQELGWAGLPDLYSVRFFRPTLFPIISLPFLVLTGGAVFTTSLISASFWLLSFTFALYLLCRAWLDRTESLLTTWLICFQAPFMSASLFFLSEVSGISFLALGALLVQRRKFGWAGLCWGLGLCIRPLETSLASLGLLPLYLFYLRPKREEKEWRFLVVAGLAAGLWLAPFLRRMEDWIRIVYLAVDEERKGLHGWTLIRANLPLPWHLAKLTVEPLLALMVTTFALSLAWRRRWRSLLPLALGSGVLLLPLLVGLFGTFEHVFLTPRYYAIFSPSFSYFSPGSSSRNRNLPGAMA